MSVLNVDQQFRLDRILSGSTCYYGTAIKKEPDIFDIIKEETSSLDQYDPTNTERIYLFLNPTTQIICPRGKKRKFSTFENGYRTGCDDGHKCLCIKDVRDVARKIELQKRKDDPEYERRIIDKQKATVKAKSESPADNPSNGILSDSQRVRLDLMLTYSPQAFHKSLNKNSDIRDVIMIATSFLDIFNPSLHERLYNFIHPDSQPFCSRGKKRKFVTFDKGYGRDLQSAAMINEDQRGQEETINTDYKEAN